DIVEFGQGWRVGEAALHHLVNKHAGDAGGRFPRVVVVPVIDVKHVEEFRELARSCTDHGGAFGFAEGAADGFVGAAGRAKAMDDVHHAAFLTRWPE
ncbi:MAG: hypothetical protein J0H99_05990, partial [Rhodospirillales bacterium]|nr:hypothetical protein [Rhodospirillales bacterium]